MLSYWAMGLIFITPVKEQFIIAKYLFYLNHRRKSKAILLVLLAVILAEFLFMYDRARNHGRRVYTMK